MRLFTVSCLFVVALIGSACSDGDRAVGIEGNGGRSNGSVGGSKAMGGSSTTEVGGSAGATAGSGAAAGAPPAGEVRQCGVVPINPNATQQAKNLLCYLYELNGKKVLSGQQETSWNPNPADDVNWIVEQTGKFPAILGGDYLYPNGTTSRAKAYWNAGGIPMIRYHMGAPPASDTYEDSKGTANIDAVLTPGTVENDSYNEKLDYASKELKVLQAANVAVLWAPLHEAQPSGWFWWSKGTGAQFVALWKYTYDYMTKAGVNNVLWLMPFSGSPNAAFYPGKDYVDIAGPDTYAKNQPFAITYSNTARIVGNSLPIPLHETGVVPQPEQMFPTAAPWVLFSVWAGFHKDPEYNTPDTIKSAYASEYTITRDEVPNLR